MKQVKVTKNFDQSKQIGILSIDKEEIPSNPNFSFEVGGKIIEQKGNVITKFELMEISLISNSGMAKKLGKRGGEATKKKLGVDHFKRISKLGVEARQK